MKNYESVFRSRNRGGPGRDGQLRQPSGWSGHERSRSLPASLMSLVVNSTPNVKSLPGSQALQSLTNGLGAWALALALIGLLIGAAAWALGAHSQNYQQSYSGRRAVLVSGLAALIIGAAPGIISFFFNTGVGVK